MIKTKISSVLASSFSLAGGKFFFGDLSLPEELVKEADEFIERNALSIVGSEIPSKAQNNEENDEIFEKAPPCCPRCLKAHLIEKLGVESIEGLEAFDEEELGHHGHYLDGGEVIKIKKTMCHLGLKA